MGPRNASYIADREMFEVLGLIGLRLPGSWWWRAEDVEDDNARGVIFRAFPESGDSEIAHLAVVDVSNDPTEPDISSLQQADIPQLDSLFEAEIAKEIKRQGSELTKWMSSQLNERAEFKALVTAYIRMDSDKERQVIAVRTSLHSRKVILMGCFDVARKDPLATQIFNAMRQAVILPALH